MDVAHATDSEKTALSLERPPVLWHQYVRGAIFGAHRHPRGPFRPRICAASAHVANVIADADHLHAYRRLCGFADAPQLPSTYPYVLATPVAAAMLVRSSFPYPLLGVVHVRQSIRQRRPIALGETMAVRTWFGDEREAARGVEFETHVQIRCDGEPVWDGVSVALVRNPAKPRTKGGQATSTAQGLESTRIRVPADLGRRYARLTQDYNPIHLWPVTARMFGFARPIVHGMWSLARGLSEFQEKVPRTEFQLDCEFRKPVTLPGEVRLFHYEDETGWGFSMRDPSGEKKHLECTVRALEQAPGARAGS